MEPQNYLGIYISKSAATVVCLGSQGRDRNVLGCFSISVEEQGRANPQALANLIAQTCAERIPMYQDCEVVVALDCAMFMQHNVHSEFDDPKQVAVTIRFDTEEALATDISDVAIAFKTTSSDQTGSELTVFTAQRKILSELILSLQSSNIDPAAIEPDVNCLSRFICQNVSPPESRQAGTLFAMLSRHSGYFITFAEPQKTPTMRTFLLSPTQDRGELLTREVPVTAALVEAGEPINRLKVLDPAGSVNCQQLSEKLSIEAGDIDLAGSANIDPDVLADCADQVDFAIAYGAALAHLEKTQSINFRSDFMPYQGKKMQLQKTLKLTSYFVTALLLIFGMYSQVQLLQRNKPIRQLHDKLAKQYSAVMLGREPSAKTRDIVRKLGTEKRRIENVKSGQLSITGEKSISAKLTLVLEAFNKCAAQTSLNIDSISITTKDIRIVGNTSSKRNTLKLFDALKKANLSILQQKLDTKGGRDNFIITVAPKNS